MKKFYSYPCEDSSDCLDFLEGFSNGLSFVQFCKTHCANCPDCIELDIPYDDDTPSDIPSDDSSSSDTSFRPLTHLEHIRNLQEYE